MERRSAAGELRAYLTGWRNYFQLADTPQVLRLLDEWIRHRLRAVQLNQWKRGRTVFRELRARGVARHTAIGVARYTRSWWRNSTQLLNVAMPASYFDGLGLPRLAA